MLMRVILAEDQKRKLKKTAYGQHVLAWLVSFRLGRRLVGIGTDVL
jgi:hypothetical protein